MLETRREVRWDELVVEALGVPMISEADVKQWVKERQTQGAAEVMGLAPRARVPQWRSNHRVRKTP